MNSSIYAIIVTFNPEVEKVNNLISNLVAQKVDVILVDNGSNNKDLISEIKYCHQIFLDKNLGIAKAQNFGIEYGLNNNAEYFLFFDQDSNINDNYINNMVEVYEKIKYEKGVNIGILGPRLYNYKFKFHYGINYLDKHGRIHTDKNEGIGLVNTDLIISSGSLISAHIIKNVGLMKANLFIDYVDFEFSFRAASCGYKNFITKEILLEHNIGDHNASFLGKNLVVHSAFRRYFILRNSLLLMRYEYIPKRYIIQSFIKNIFTSFLLLFVVNNKKDYIKAYYHALRDGFIGSKK
ncbi:MAG: glycosyltransferase family 2 protein [Acinetobacter populi]|uniref:glycosyltransferase family 2 protein n=1 Tax=Acinetobacter populi TaxID=1582270 RepID=UPI0023579B2D|nr:glycosyltransferase family 2 protein [Acinetobacter populi]MCH4248683.1 glycosyltransferase family 2 protein [Acinetobacter populi]